MVKIRTKKLLICIIALGFLLAYVSQSQGKARSTFLGFKKEKKSQEVPEGWEVISYFRTVKNKLSLSTEGKRTVLEVRSMGSASAVLKRLEVDLNKFPVLVWRWKINRVVGMAVEDRKDRNDAAARIRVIFGRPTPTPKTPEKPPEIFKFFESFQVKMARGEPKGYKIDYIWGNAMPRGTVIDYPGSKRHKMVVVQSGDTRANRWVWEKRNLSEDFRSFFGDVPPLLIGIVVLTDTDQTNEGVIAHYSSIIMMRE